MPITEPVKLIVGLQTCGVGLGEEQGCKEVQVR